MSKMVDGFSQCDSNRTDRATCCSCSCSCYHCLCPTCIPVISRSVRVALVVQYPDYDLPTTITPHVHPVLMVRGPPGVEKMFIIV